MGKASESGGQGSRKGTPTLGKTGFVGLDIVRVGEGAIQRVATQSQQGRHGPVWVRGGDDRGTHSGRVP